MWAVTFIWSNLSYHQLCSHNSWIETSEQAKGSRLVEKKYFTWRFQKCLKSTSWNARALFFSTMLLGVLRAKVFFFFLIDVLVLGRRLSACCQDSKWGRSLSSNSQSVWSELYISFLLLYCISSIIYIFIYLFIYGISCNAVRQIFRSMDDSWTKDKYGASF